LRGVEPRTKGVLGIERLNGLQQLIGSHDVFGVVIYEDYECHPLSRASLQGVLPHARYQYHFSIQKLASLAMTRSGSPQSTRLRDRQISRRAATKAR